ncbi:MAG: carotenoid biosynthesis protein [Candidatus Heimdallarchaeota archaeon]|nr:MAG: carotenoid biosynthesis protein [Candidatus Heimdallarchaeota archaeon]
MGIITSTTEIMAYILFFIVISILSFRRDFHSVAQVLSGSLFGVTLEYMNIQVMQTYIYSSQFLLQLGSPPDNIPICIGLCWGLIIYACMNVSNKIIEIPEWLKPLLDGLLALTIDLSMDTIAIRLDGGFWTWLEIPMENLPTLNSFFGVNYGNFVGWFFVVLIFSTMLRIEEKWIAKKFSRSVILVLYFLIIPFFSYIPLFLSFHTLPLPVFIIFNILGFNGESTNLMELAILVYIMTLVSIIFFIALIRSKPKLEKDADLLSLTIFMFFHLSYLGFYLLDGLFEETPLILLIASLMFTIDAMIHYSILDKKRLSLQIEKLKKAL